MGLIRKQIYPSRLNSQIDRHFLHLENFTDQIYQYQITEVGHIFMKQGLHNFFFFKSTLIKLHFQVHIL